jgi:hypothetical protein
VWGGWGWGGMGEENGASAPSGLIAATCAKGRTSGEADVAEGNVLHAVDLGIGRHGAHGHADAGLHDGSLNQVVAAAALDKHLARLDANRVVEVACAHAANSCEELGGACLKAERAFDEFTHG